MKSDYCLWLGPHALDARLGALLAAARLRLEQLDNPRGLTARLRVPPPPRLVIIQVGHVALSPAANQLLAGIPRLNVVEQAATTAGGGWRPRLGEWLNLARFEEDVARKILARLGCPVGAVARGPERVASAPADAPREPAPTPVPPADPLTAAAEKFVAVRLAWAKAHAAFLDVERELENARRELDAALAAAASRQAA